MAAWSRPGDVLRWWRSEVLGWSQQQLADRLAIGASTVSNWEHGTRGISVDLEVLDQAVKGQGVLAALLRAFGTPSGLPAGRVWTKVYPGPSSPVWMWVRSPRPRIKIEGEWGVVSFETKLDLGPNGVFVTVGGSVPDSPVVVQLSTPGWADFGRGDLPESTPGAQIVAAVDHVRPSSAQGVFMDLFTADLQQHLQRYEHGIRPTSSATDEAHLAVFANRFSQATPREPPGPWPPLPEGTDQVDRQRFAALRKARGLSLLQAADQLAAVTDLTVSKDTLRRFEIDQGEPYHRFLPAALDHILGAEGHLALTTIRSSHGSGLVRFPDYWHAPVWLSIDDTHHDINIELRWAKWARRVQGNPPLLLVSHYADPQASLRIIAGPSTHWTIGLGRPKRALPINHGWIPISVEATHQALSTTRNAILDAIRRYDDNNP